MKKIITTLTLVSTLAMGTVPAFAAGNTNGGGNGTITITGNDQSTQNININNTTTVTNNVYNIQFDDTKNHWARDAIADLAKKGILAGDGQGHFNPDKEVTREQFAKMVSTAYKLKNNSTQQDFEDVKPNSWSFNFVEASKNYMTAYKALDGGLLFRPEMNANRQDVAVTLIEILAAEGQVQVMDSASADALLKDSFSDWDHISTSVRPYVATAVKSGIIKGDEGKFKPFDALTRAQAATVLKRAAFESVVVVGQTPAPTPVPVPVPVQPAPTQPTQPPVDQPSQSTTTTP